MESGPDSVFNHAASKNSGRATPPKRSLTASAIVLPFARRPILIRQIPQPWLALIILLAVAPSAAAQTEEPLPDLIKRVKRAVVVVTTYDCRGNPLLRGNGFFIESNRFITNRHVLGGACQAQIKTFDGRTYPVEGVVAADERRDLILLQVSAPSSQTATLAVEKSMPRVGEEIIVVSNPRGSSWSVSRGATSSIWDFQGIGEVIQFEASISPGCSGGPLVNRQGRVVGVVVMQVSSSDELNFAVPAERIKEFRLGPLSPLTGLSAQPSK